MHQIARHPEAFSNDLRSKDRKRPRVRDDEYLDWIRTLPSVIEPRGNVEAAHVRYGDAFAGKRTVGKAEKPDDRWALPLSSELHREQHSGSERAFWHKHGVNPILVCMALYQCFQDEDDDRAQLIISKTWRAEK